MKTLMVTWGKVMDGRKEDRKDRWKVEGILSSSGTRDVFITSSDFIKEEVKPRGVRRLVPK